jgi:hypothetical protein
MIPPLEEPERLQPVGWIFMLASMAFVWGLALWCFKRVLSAPKTPPDPVKDFHSA